MVKLLEQLQERKRVAENGFTVVEIMVSAIVIAIILVSAAAAITSAVRSGAYIENQTKAYQLANQQIALTKQAPYTQLWLARTATADMVGADKCQVTSTGAPAGFSWATSGEGTQYPGLQYCQTKRFGNASGVGATFYVQTTIAYVRTAAAYDGSNIGATPAHFYAKRVVVTVKWKDITNDDTNFNSVQQTYTRTPSIEDCVPDTVTFTGTLVGCQP